MHDDLLRVAKGEVFSDDWTRSAYSVDASHFEVVPEAVVFPSDADDIRNICGYAYDRGIPIGTRGAGTGLLGQSLCDGIVMDFTKHMNKLMEIGDDYVVSQPGMVKAVLDMELKKKGKFLPPDPASSNFCTIGGMVANNSSGIHCLGYGNTVDFLEGVQFVYPDGGLGHADDKCCDEKTGRLEDILVPHHQVIQSSYPKVSKNSCGYRLDSVVQEGRFRPQKVFAASEGTLGIMTEARLRILDIPEHRCMIVGGFSDVAKAIAKVPSLLTLHPSALEMMDHSVVAPGIKSADGGCLLFIEFDGTKSVAERMLSKCRGLIGDSALVLEYASDEASLARIWAARKGALNNIMKLTVGSRKPVGLIEDTVVSPDNLLGHVTDLVSDYNEMGLDYVLYGHAGDGNIHTRPVIDLESAGQIRMMQALASRVFQRVVERGGTITGEHGDGIGRMQYLELVYSRKIRELFREIKELFDPKYLLNPGKKVPQKVR